MTTPSEAYLASLGRGEAAAALDAAEPAVEREEGPSALARCLEARLVLETDRRADTAALAALKSRAAAAWEAVARAGEGDAVIEAAVRAAELLREVSDEDAAARAVELAVEAALGDEARLKAAVLRLGGSEEATLLFRRRLKAPDVKKDAAKNAALRRTLARLAEVLGDLDAAFFEMLGAVRKAPDEPLYVDEAFRLALATERHEEVTAVFRELAKDERVPVRQRATLYNKLGHVAERGLGDVAAALAAYEASLELNPDSKGARRHKERLREQLNGAQSEGLLVERDAPAPERTPPPSESASLRSAEVTSPGRSVLRSSSASSVESTALERTAAAPPPPASDEEPEVREEAIDDSDVVEEAPRPLPFEAATDPETTVADPALRLSSLPPPLPADEDDWDHDSAPGLPPRVTDVDDSTAVLEVFGSDVETALELKPGPTAEAGGDLGSDVETREAPVAPAKSKRKKKRKKKSEARAPEAVAEASMALAEPSAEDVFASSGSDASAEPEPDTLRGSAPGSAFSGMSLEPTPPMPLVPPPGEPGPLSPRAPVAEDAPTRVTPLARMRAQEPPASLASTADASLDDGVLPPPLPKEEPEPDEPLADAPAPALEDDGAPPPSSRAPTTLEGPAARDLFSEADTLLAGDDGEGALDCALLLKERPDKGSLVLRLAGHALRLRAPSGALPERAVALFVDEAPAKPDVAAALALEVRDALPAEARHEGRELWIAAARGAGVAAAAALLEELAREDAPTGPAFIALDEVLARAGDLAARLALRVGAARQLGDEGRLAALLEEHIALLVEAGRPEETLPLHARLALDVAPEDEEQRRRALEAFDAHADIEERTRFLGRLARAVPGEAGVPIVRRLLSERLALDDGVGAEAAARDLLERRPGDDEALRALTALLEGHAHRAAELVEVHRLRLTIAKNRRDDELRRQVTRALLALLVELERWPEATEAVLEAMRAAPDDAALLEAAELLGRAHRYRELLALYQEASAVCVDPAQRADLLLAAARVARERLQKRGQAEELVDEALEAAPDHVPALLARADLAVELGDPQAALMPLERLAARLVDAKERAQVHFRIGRLLEEHLLRPDDALKRYRAAVEGDPAHRDAWDALRALARQRDDRELHTEALRGLCVLEEEPRLRAALLRQIARIERDERVDLEAAERAFAEALEADPGDDEAVMGLLALMAARLAGEHDTERALSSPPDLLLAAVYEPLAPVFARAEGEGARPAFAVRRLFALALLHRGERAKAAALLSELLEEAPTDLPTLRALAEALASADVDNDDSDDDVQQRRLKVLETMLLHHAPDLDDKENVRLWGEVGATRWRLGERAQAKKPLRKALELASDAELRAALSDDAVDAIVAALVEDPGGDEEPRRKVAALRLSAARRGEEEAAAALERAAHIARADARDAALCRKLLAEAIAAWPEGRSAKEALLDLDMAEGNAAAAIDATRELLDTEADPKQQASYHLRLAGLLRRARGDDDEIAAHLKSALRLAPESRDALDAAESFFEDRDDKSGLAALYAAQLKGVDPKNVPGRIALLERLAQVRRYDLRDLAGAAEALEAVSALDPDAIKPREDSARIYTELGRWREAVTAWRAVLERDPLAGEAWRGLFAIYARTGQADEAFAVAAAMTSVEVADEDMARVVRRVRPPFPRWPRAPKDSRAFRRKIGHPLERTPVRLVLDLVGPRAHAVMARPLKDFGLRKKDRLGERQVPPSVLLAVRTVSEMIGLTELPPLYRAQLGTVEGEGPPFALLPVSEPGIVVSEDVLKGGMTPERAFALGRAMAWLMPHATMAGTLEAPALKEVLEALVLRFVPGAPVDGNARGLERLGGRLEAEIFRGLGSKDVEALRDALSAALRDYVHARGQLHLADWIAGVGYTADRLGFLLVGDLAPSTRVIKSTASRSQALGARLAIKELVLFSASAAYLTLRRELGIALPEDAARPVLELA